MILDSSSGETLWDWVEQVHDHGLHEKTRSNSERACAWLQAAQTLRSGPVINASLERNCRAMPGTRKPSGEFT